MNSGVITLVLAPPDIFAIMSSTVLSLPGFSPVLTLLGCTSAVSVLRTHYWVAALPVASLLIPNWSVQRCTERDYLASKI